MTIGGTSTPKRERIIVVGAGIAGLGAAFRLQEAGHEVVVLEGENKPGGRMATVRRGDYTIDIGASLLPSSHKAVLKLTKDAGLSRLVQRKLLIGGVVRDGRIHHLGPSPLEAVKTSLFSWESKKALVKTLAGIKRRVFRADWYGLEDLCVFDYQTAAAYSDRNLTGELLEYFVEPVLGSIFFAPPERLSALDLVFALANFSPMSFNSVRGGDFLVTGLAQKLPVRCSARVEQIETSGSGVRVSWVPAGESGRVEEASACVVSVPAYQVPSIYPRLDAERRELIDRLEYSTSVAVHLGLDRRPAENAVAVFMPRIEDPNLCIAVFDHNKAGGRAPDGKGLLATYWRGEWGAEQWDLDDELIVKRALPSIAKVIPGLESNVELAHVQRWRRGTVSQPGMYHDMARWTQISRTDAAVQFCGDYFGVGSSVNSSLISGEQAAARLIQRFGGEKAVALSCGRPKRAFS